MKKRSVVSVKRLAAACCLACIGIVGAASGSAWGYRFEKHCAEFVGGESGRVDDLRKDAEQGSSYAQIMLTVIYAGGCGVAINEREATKWARICAEQGKDADCLPLLVALLYDEDSAGNEQKDREAARWARKCAERGQVNCQYYLGSMYLFGRGVPKDANQSYTWFKKAADQGDSAAQEAVDLFERELAKYRRQQAKPLTVGEALQSIKDLVKRGR